MAKIELIKPSIHAKRLDPQIGKLRPVFIEDKSSNDPLIDEYFEQFLTIVRSMGHTAQLDISIIEYPYEFGETPEKAAKDYMDTVKDVADALSICMQKLHNGKSN